MNHVVRIIAFVILCSPLLDYSCYSQITKSGFFSINDSTKIYYEQEGRASEVIVFIHGFGCDVNAWKAQTRFFSSDYKTVCIDLPGYGKSDKPHTEYTLDYFAQAVKTVLDSLEIPQAIFVGHSLGTAVCRQVLFNYPDLIKALVDVDGVYCFYPENSAQRLEYENQINGFVSLFKGDSVKQNITSFVDALCTKKTPQFVKDYALRIMPETPEYVAFSTMYNLVDTQYWKGSKITIPTFVLASKNSGIPTNYKAVMQQLYSDMEYRELDSVGHFIMMEQPKMFNKTLLHFIKNSTNK